MLVLKVLFLELVLKAFFLVLVLKVLFLVLVLKVLVAALGQQVVEPVGQVEDGKQQGEDEPDTSVFSSSLLSLNRMKNESSTRVIVDK